MKSGNIGGEIEIIVIDKETGKILTHIKKPMNSFVVNMKNLITLFENNPGYGYGWSATNTNGVGRVIDIQSGVFLIAPGGDHNYGILVGSSDSPFDVSQYNLINKIPHGVGAGQLSYGAVTVAEDTPTYKTWQRPFDNLSGGDVVVKEIGIACKYVAYLTLSQLLSETGYVLLARDVIPTTVVPNNTSLVVKYTFKINP
jgi:hypothetical protein